MAAGPHVSLSAETLFQFGPLEVSNSILTSTVISALLILVALIVRTQITSTDKPKGIQNFFELIVESLYNMVHSVTNDHRKTVVFLPLIASFFIFILTNNWFGLLPGVGTIGITKDEHASIPAVMSVEPAMAATEVTDTHATDDHGDEIIEASSHDLEDGAEVSHGESHEIFVPIFRPGTADLNTTLALAIFSVFAVQIMGIQFQGLNYFSKFINFSSPIMFFVGILEIISEFAKIVSFAFRLFGNIFAGEVLLVVIGYLTKIIVPVPFYGLEVFVGFIQALVFAMLSLVFFNMATQGHEH